MKHWQGLTKHLDNQAVFSLTWESQKKQELYKTIGKTVGKIALNALLTYSGGPVSKVGVIVASSESLYEIKAIQDLFQRAKKSAKRTGKLLAIALALR